MTSGAGNLATHSLRRLEHGGCYANIAVSQSHVPSAVIALAGDFNTLDNFDIISRNSLSPIVDQPTRGENYPDRI